MLLESTNGVSGLNVTGFWLFIAVSDNIYVLLCGVTYTMTGSCTVNIKNDAVRFFCHTMKTVCLACCVNRCDYTSFAWA